jgi:hypothetical protein
MTKPSSFLQDDPVLRPLPLLLLLSLASCAPAAVHANRDSDFNDALEQTVASAQRQLIATGSCTWRTWSRCAGGFAITHSDGFVSGSQYFDRTGKLIGADASGCFGGESSGRTLSCRDTEEVLLCPMALAQLRRVAVSVGAAGRTVRLERDGELDLIQFRGRVQFEPSALTPVSLTVTALEPSVRLRAERSDVEVFQLGDSFELPAMLYANETFLSVSVRSHYVAAEKAHPLTPPSAELLQQRDQLVQSGHAHLDDE